MEYDDASWHFNGNFPENTPDEYGGTHIALFMKWCFIQGWASELHTEDEPAEVQRVVNGEMSATEFLFDYCDGKLTDEDFSDEGNKFAEIYYGDNGRYLSDYAENFGDLLYVASESDHDFEKFSKMIDQRRKSGILSK